MTHAQVVPSLQVGPPEPESPEDFSFVLGGPSYQLFLRLHMLRGGMELLVRRIIFLAALAWLPLSLLAILDRRAWGGVQVPFFKDTLVHVRFLVSLPLLVFAEYLVHHRLQPVIREFLKRGIIRPEQRARFDAIIASSKRLRNSVVAEVLLLVFVLTVGHLLWEKRIALHAPTWYGDPDGDGVHLTRAGWYFAFISMPVFQFLLIRWYFRIVIWCQFLFRVSRLDLRLIPTHPDRSGGIGFLEGSANALAPILIAQSALLAGLIADRIFHGGGTLKMFRWEIVGMTVVLLVVALSPLVVFAPNLLAARRIGLRDYGRLATDYVLDFDRKWVRGEAGNDALLGSADIQSLADLGNSFGLIRDMRVLPFGKQTIVRLAVAVLIPLAPLVLTIMPVDELLERFLKAMV